MLKIHIQSITTGRYKNSESNRHHFNNCVFLFVYLSEAIFNVKVDKYILVGYVKYNQQEQNVKYLQCLVCLMSENN